MIGLCVIGLIALKLYTDAALRKAEKDMAQARQEQKDGISKTGSVHQ